MLSAVVRGALAALFAALVVAPPPVITAPPQVEIRALWVVRTSLASPSAIAAMVDAARSGGFNTLLVQVRGRGDAYYQHAMEPRPATLAAQPSFDPLATTIARAHDAGLSVHAWINVNLVAGNEPPPAADHVVYQHPEWLMVPASLANDLLRVDPRSPAYVTRLFRYVRARPNEIEGLYLSPVSEAAAAYTVSIVRDIADRYAIDGVHLDYVRYPDEDFDYGGETLGAFRRAIDADLSPSDRRLYDAQLKADPVIYSRAFPDRWRAFRSDRVTALVSRVRDAVRGVRPDAVLSAAVAPDPTDAAFHRLQDWRTWLERGLIDVVCPMAYTTDAAVFAAQITAARRIAGGRAVWAGIGAYRLSAGQIVENVHAARRLGAAGVILFSYDSLTDPPHGPDYFAQVARAVFGAQ